MMTREASLQLPATPSETSNDAPSRFIGALYQDLLRHDGFAGFTVEMRILKKRQKEIIVHCGKQFRFVVDFDPESQRRFSD